MARGQVMTDTTIQPQAWTPNWAVHPGAILQEHLEARGLSQAELARLAGLSAKLVSTIINERNPISAETAIRLERVLGLKAYIWTGIQAKWDLFRARRAAMLISKPAEWLSQFPIKELRERGVVPDTKDTGALMEALLSFFEIGLPQTYAAKVGALAVHHRQSKAHESSNHHVFSWLMLGEWRARAMNLPPFDAGKFQEAIRQIRLLTTEQPSVFLPRMKQLCHNAGVALVLEPPISKTCLFGSARWFDVDRAIIQMSLRMATNDHFWWTFFHEAAHITLHRGRNFADDQNGEGDGAEDQADRWAENVLVGRERFSRFKALRPRSKAQVLQFAADAELHPGIVVGMLQHARTIDFSNLNGLKEKIQWAEKVRATRIKPLH
jgi:HTH-type transcriptional regulator / antitoxin HigA